MRHWTRLHWASNCAHPLLMCACGGKVVRLHGEEPGEVRRVLARAGVRPARRANLRPCLRDGVPAEVHLISLEASSVCLHISMPCTSQAG